MKVELLEIAGFKSAFKGMRNPMNSWDLSDSYINNNGDFIIGNEDMKLAKKLIRAGKEHRKFLRQIKVWMDIDLPRYVWSEFDTYKYNTKNSCSTMHKLFNQDTELTVEQFLFYDIDKNKLEIIVDWLNGYRQVWLNAKDSKEKNICLKRAKRLLPEGFLQLRTVDSNYEEIFNIYFQRRHHRLDEEWGCFCDFAEKLPYFMEFKSAFR